MDYVKQRLRPILILLAAIWAVEVVNIALGHRLTGFGILPRSVAGLIGIPLTPFIHASIWHTISNTIPLAVLGGLTIVSGERRFWNATVGIIVLSGVLVWIFARSSFHVGASGLVFGYFGVLLTRAVIERTTLSIVIGFVTILFYGGLLFGILPVGTQVSFEGHLFGLLAGVAVVWLENRTNRAPHL